MADRVRVQKREYGSKGGDPLDDTPYIDEIDPNEDGVDCRSVFLQNDTSEDSTVEISRDAASPDNMTFKDGVQTTAVTLTALLGGEAAALLGKAVFKVDGGLVYDTDGDVVIKEVQ